MLPSIYFFPQTCIPLKSHLYLLSFPGLVLIFVHFSTAIWVSLNNNHNSCIQYLKFNQELLKIHIVTWFMYLHLYIKVQTEEEDKNSFDECEMIVYSKKTSTN